MDASVGRRGRGKTHVLLSYHSGLKKFLSRKKKQQRNKKTTSKKDVKMIKTVNM